MTISPLGGGVDLTIVKSSGQRHPEDGAVEGPPDHQAGAVRAGAELLEDRPPFRRPVEASGVRPEDALG